MEIKIKTINDILDIRILGELDANSSIELDEIIKDALAQQQIKIMVNCLELSYISSAGMGVFISHLDDLKKLGGRFVFYNMSSGVFSVFEILGLHNMIDIVEKQIEAQRKFDES